MTARPWRASHPGCVQAGPGDLQGVICQHRARWVLPAVSVGGGDSSWFPHDSATPWTVAQTSLSMGFFQARILEWVAISFSRGSSRPGDRTGKTEEKQFVKSLISPPRRSGGCLGGSLMQASRPIREEHCQALALARDASWAVEFVLKRSLCSVGYYGGSLRH